MFYAYIIYKRCNCSEAGAKNNCSSEARLSVVGAIGCYCKKKSGGVVLAAKRVAVAAKRSEHKNAAAKRGGREELQSQNAFGGKLHRA